MRIDCSTGGSLANRQLHEKALGFGLLLVSGSPALVAGEEQPDLTFAQSPAVWIVVGLSAGVAVLALVFLGIRTRRLLRSQRELEERLRLQGLELARSQAARVEFLAAIGHEVQDPMNGVVGILRMLQESSLGNREKSLLIRLHRCVSRLGVTFDGILDLAKYEAGERGVASVPFDLAEAVRAAIAAADVTGDKVELASWTGDHPVVLGDQRKLTQILTNYVSNALSFGVPARATVEVTVLNENETRCRFTASVRHQGPALQGGDVSSVFDRFSQEGSPKLRRIGGSGLGLALCKKYAEAMGGSVAATTAAGTTVFTVTLPLEKVEGSGVRLHVPADQKSRYRALAIQDEDYNRLVLGNLLSKLGYSVDWAEDGKSALELARQHSYDLILTGCLLRDMDGCVLTRQLLELSEEPKPPVIAVTAYTSQQKREECLAAGMVGFISKPVSMEALEAALGACGALKQGGAASEAEEDVTSISLTQLSRLGQVEVIVPEFVGQLERDWSIVERSVESAPLQAASDAHRLISVGRLVDARQLSDQLGLLEEQLRAGTDATAIKQLVEICREEIGRVAASLRAAVERQRRLSANRKST